MKMVLKIAYSIILIFYSCTNQKVTVAKPDSGNSVMVQKPDSNTAPRMQPDTLSEREKNWALNIANKAKGNMKIPEGSQPTVLKNDTSYIVTYNSELAKDRLGSDYDLRVIINKEGKVVQILVGQ